MATQHGARLVFDNAKALVHNAGFNVNQAVLSQSYIRSEITMSTSTTSYHVPVLINDTQNGASFPTENRLQLQDAFVISSIGVFVAIPTATTTTAFPYYTYPNKVAFSTTGAAAALYNLYNGQLNFVVNNRQIVPSWDLYRHLCVNQTQEGTATGTSNTAIDQNDASQDGYFPCEPNIVLVGSKNNQLSLQLPSAISTLQASVNPRIVVIFRGILAQNVTPVR
jgi:hypothetical protein